MLRPHLVEGKCSSKATDKAWQTHAQVSTGRLTQHTIFRNDLCPVLTFMKVAHACKLGTGCRKLQSLLCQLTTVYTDSD